MQLITCTYDQHGEAIRDIFNDVIAISTAIYAYEPRPPAEIRDWFAGRQRGNFPVVGMIDATGTLLGFASYGTFRDRPAYKYSIEHSIYVHKDHYGKGIGTALLKHLIDLARSQQYHVLVAGIDLDNRASVALHEKLGFRHVGTLPQVGFKFGRWLDLAFYQLLLDTPIHPVDV